MTQYFISDSISPLICQSVSIIGFYRSSWHPKRYLNVARIYSPEWEGQRTEDDT